MQNLQTEPPKIYRWLVLVFVSLAMFGNYYIYDSIAPIADILKSDLGFSDENIGQMYSVYSIAAIIVLLLGGVFIDRYGTKISIDLLCCICDIFRSPERDIQGDIEIGGAFLWGWSNSRTERN